MLTAFPVENKNRRKTHAGQCNWPESFSGYVETHEIQGLEKGDDGRKGHFARSASLLSCPKNAWRERIAGTCGALYRYTNEMNIWWQLWPVFT